MICGKSGKEVPLDKAHWKKPRSDGGKDIILLCPNHHRRYHAGLLTSAELKKIGLTEKEYERYVKSKKKQLSKPDEKYYYLWGDGKKRYKSEMTLPKSACKAGKHNWTSSFAFEKYVCTKCKAKRVLR